MKWGSAEVLRTMTIYIDFKYKEKRVWDSVSSVVELPSLGTFRNPSGAGACIFNPSRADAGQRQRQADFAESKVSLGYAPNC